RCRAARGARAAPRGARRTRLPGEPGARAARRAPRDAPADGAERRRAVLLPAAPGRGEAIMMGTGHGSAARARARGRAARAAAYAPLVGSREEVLRRHLPLVRR